MSEVDAASDQIPFDQEKLQLLDSYFAALRTGQWSQLASFYHAQISYASPLFPDVRKELVQASWEYLLGQIQNIETAHEIQFCDERKAHLSWVITYKLRDRPRKKVRLKGRTSLSFWDNKIVRQVDDWHLYAWAGKQFGLMGKLFGWSNSFRDQMQSRALDAMHMQKTGYR